MFVGLTEKISYDNFAEDTPAGMLGGMPNFYSEPLFRCKSCFALYQVIKAPADPKTIDLEIACRVCNAPLPAREGQFVLKYFLLRKASRSEVQPVRRGFRHKKASAPKAPAIG